MSAPRPAWFAALAGVAALAYWSAHQGGQDDDLLAGSSTANVAAAAPTAPAEPVPIDWNNAWQREAGTAPAGDLFRQAARHEAAEAKPNAAPARPRLRPTPAPVVVPLPPPPFRYLGKLERGGRLDIYLGGNGAALVAHLGDTLPGGWRLDSLDATGLGVTRLADGEHLTLSLS